MTISFALLRGDAPSSRWHIELHRDDGRSKTARFSNEIEAWKHLRFIRMSDMAARCIVRAPDGTERFVLEPGFNVAPTPSVPA